MIFDASNLLPGHILISSGLESYIFAVLVSITLLLCVWRLWRFSLLPILRPDEPKEIPYWIPVLGHAISFLRHSDRVFTNGREYLGNTREPFAITLAGEKLYVLTSPRDVGESFRNTETLSHDSFVEDLMRSFGVSDPGIGKMYQNFTPGGHVMYHPNPNRKCLARLTVDLHKHQLLPGVELKGLSDTFIHYLDRYLRWEKMDRIFVLEDTMQNHRTVSLLSWCLDVLLKASTNVFFGERLLQLDPSLPKSFYEFDKNAWKVLYHYPEVLSKNMSAPLTRNIRAVTRYFKLPKSERTGATWFTQTLEAEQRQLGMTDGDIARTMMLVHWGVNTNTFKLCFWVLSYLLHDTKLLNAIRAETANTISDGIIDIKHLMNHCPKLEAVFFEVMRLTASSASMRKIIAPTNIGGKILQPGYRIIVPYRQLHYNQEVFGEDADDFDPERFLRNKDLSHHPSFRPFGGGANYCPGRFIARQEVNVFIALVLSRFDIGLSEKASHTHLGTSGQHLPKAALSKPCLGIMSPANGEDVIIDVKQRTYQ